MVFEVKGLFPTTPFGFSVLALGLGLLLAGCVAVGWMMVYFRTSVKPAGLGAGDRIMTLEYGAYLKYREAVDQIFRAFQSNTLSFKDAHTAWAAILRAAASLASGSNMEVATVRDIRARFQWWPALADTLEMCEGTVFSAGDNRDVHLFTKNYTQVVSVLQDLKPAGRWFL